MPETEVVPARQKLPILQQHFNTCHVSAKRMPVTCARRFHLWLAPYRQESGLQSFRHHLA